MMSCAGPPSGLFTYPRPFNIELSGPARPPCPQILLAHPPGPAISTAALGGGSDGASAGARLLGREQLETLGELMYQSHASYSRCGLGSEGTDRLVELVR